MFSSHTICFLFILMRPFLHVLLFNKFVSLYQTQLARRSNHSATKEQKVTRKRASVYLLKWVCVGQLPNLNLLLASVISFILLPIWMHVWHGNNGYIDPNHDLLWFRILRNRHMNAAAIFIPTIQHLTRRRSKTMAIQHRIQYSRGID